MFVAAARTTRKVASHSAVARWTMRGALGFNPIVSSAFSNVARVRQMGAMPHAHRWALAPITIARAAGGGRGGRGTGARVRPRRGRPDEEPPDDAPDQRSDRQPYGDRTGRC